MTLGEKVELAKRLIRDYEHDHEGRICIGCSFGKDSMVLLDLALEVRPALPVVCVMAETEFQETLDFAHEVAEGWALDYTELVFVQEHEGDVSKCCGRPKVEAMRKALEPYDAWFSGVRNTEGITRSNFPYVDMQGGLTKVNPILDFTETDIWRYTALHALPVNPMYRRGYRSLGCRICSTPEQTEGESERAGRWRGCEKEECGIHTEALRA